MEKHSLENQAKNIVMERFIKLTEKYPDKSWNWGICGHTPIHLFIFKSYITTHCM